MDYGKECIILAGGFGTRLQPVVKDVPKCMAEVAGKPFLSYIFHYLQKEDFSHIVLSLGYKSEIIIEWLEYNKFGFDISYVIEDKPLGTGGAIKYAMSKCRTESVVVMNGDTYFSIDMSKFVAFNIDKKVDITIALKPMSDFDRYGSVELGQNERIIKFNEKKICKSGLINGGTYLINKRIFDNFNFPEVFSFERDLLENKSLDLTLFGYIEDSYFIDIGIPEDFEKANVDFLTIRNG